MSEGQNSKGEKFFPESWAEFKTTFLSEIAPHFLESLLVIIFGFIIIKLFMKLLKKAFSKTKVERTAYDFILSLTRAILYFVLGIITLSIIGIPMTSIIALLGVAGLAISLAIKDSLANLAGGFIILLAKPFKVDDYVEFDGVAGTVFHISIIQTKLLTLDNKTIIIPNGQVSDGKIINYSTQKTRRVDLEFSIAYKDDFNKAKAIINEIINNHELILSAPEAIVRVCRLGANSVDIATRVWVNTSDYWTVNYDLHEMIKLSFDENGITIPFNQLDVNLIDK